MISWEMALGLCVLTGGITVSAMAWSYERMLDRIYSVLYELDASMHRPARDIHLFSDMQMSKFLDAFALVKNLVGGEYESDGCTFGVVIPTGAKVPSGQALRPGLKWCYMHKRSAPAGAVSCVNTRVK